MTTSNRIMSKSRLVPLPQQWVQCTSKASPVTRSESNRAPLGCGWMRNSQHECATDSSAATMWCNQVNMDKNIKRMFPKNFCDSCRKEWRLFWHERWSTQLLIHLKTFFFFSIAKCFWGRRRWICMIFEMVDDVLAVAKTWHSFHAVSKVQKNF